MNDDSEPRDENHAVIARLITMNADLRRAIAEALEVAQYPWPAIMRVDAMRQVLEDAIRSETA